MSKIEAWTHWPIPRKVFLEQRTDELERICANQSELIQQLRNKIGQLSNSVYCPESDRWLYLGR